MNRIPEHPALQVIRIIIVALVVASAPYRTLSAQRQPVTIASPHGQLSARIMLNNAGELRYVVAHAGRDVLQRRGSASSVTMPISLAR